MNTLLLAVQAALRSNPAFTPDLFAASQFSRYAACAQLGRPITEFMPWALYSMRGLKRESSIGRKRGVTLLASPIGRFGSLAGESAV